MVIKLAYDDDEDLPWDGVWEYVLGPDEPEPRRRRSYRNSQDPPTGDFFDYFLPLVDDGRESPSRRSLNSGQGRSSSPSKRSLQSRQEESKAVPFIPSSQPLKRDSSLQSSVASSKGSVTSTSKRRFWRRKERKEDPPGAEYGISDVLNSFIEDPEEEPQRAAIVGASESKSGKRRGFWRRRNNHEDDRSDLESIESMLGPWQGGSGSAANGMKRVPSTKQQKEKSRRNSASSEIMLKEKNRRGSGSSQNKANKDGIPKLKRRDSWGEDSTAESLAESVFVSSWAEPAASDLGSVATNSTDQAQRKAKRPKSQEKKLAQSSRLQAREENEGASSPAFALLTELASWINETSSGESEGSSYSSLKNMTSNPTFGEDLSVMTESDASTNNGRDAAPSRAHLIRQAYDRELAALQEEAESDDDQFSEVHLKFSPSSNDDMSYRYLPPIIEEERSKGTLDDDRSHARKLTGSDDERTSAAGSTRRRDEQFALHTMSHVAEARDQGESSNRAGSRASGKAGILKTKGDLAGENASSTEGVIYDDRQDNESTLFRPIDGEIRSSSQVSHRSGLSAATRATSPALSEAHESLSPRSKGGAVSPQESHASKGWAYQESESSSSRGGFIRSRQHRALTLAKFCSGIKDFPDVRRFSCAEDDGEKIRELSSDDLAEMFPKLRVVSDDANSDKKAELCNSNSFDAQYPAHLQFPVTDSSRSEKGDIQSLYEYEYEKGKHMNIVYSFFGPDPRECLQIVSYDTPPQSVDQGLVSFNKVVVQIEASTVSLADCFVRRGGELGEHQVSLPNTPGIDMVGRLFRIDKESSRKYDLKVGQRVISLVRNGGNARYLGVDPSALVKVPEEVDPAAAVCLVESYLAGFQMLHIGQGQLTRCRKTALQGMTILVIGGMASNTGRAIAELSKLAGAKHIFATAKQKHFKKLNSLGVLPLNLDPLVWWSNLEGSIDLLISLGEEIQPVYYKLLKPTGTLVSNSKENSTASMSSSQAPSSSNMLTQRIPAIVCSSKSKLTCAHTATHDYDIFKEWDEHPTRSKADLAHLVQLLKQGHLNPCVLERIPLSKVARAQELVESKHRSGYIVCEPWLVSKARTLSL